MFPGFQIGKFFLGMYGICTLVGIFTAFPLALHLYKKKTGDWLALLTVFLIGAAGLFVGMHLLYGLTNVSYWKLLFNAESFKQWIERFAAIFGGAVFYGGLIGGLAAGGAAIWKMKLPAALATDCAAVAIPMFHGFARIGCFMGGCCYGVEWEHGVTFTNSLVESANGVPRVPIQLFESGFEFLLFGLIFLLYTKNVLRGRLLCVYLLLYPVGRFILEFWRGDEYRGFVFGLSTSQFISVLVFTASFLWLVITSFRKKKAKLKGSV